MVKAEVNLDVDMSISYIKNLLNKNNLKGCIAEEVPDLSARQKQSRLQFARTCLQKPTGFWNSVDFTDECKFELYPKGRTYV